MMWLHSTIPIRTKCLGSAGIPLFILFLLLSGCATLGSEKKKVSDRYSNVTVLVQQNQLLEASIIERDKMMVALSVRLNKLADKFKAVLAEKKELEKRIAMRDQDFAKSAENIEHMIIKNQRLEQEPSKTRRELPEAMAEVSELKDKVASLRNKLRASQEITKSLDSEVVATLKLNEMYRSMTKNLINRILTGDVVLLHNRKDISIRFPNLNMFGSGEVNTSKEGEKLLKEVAVALKEAGAVKVKVYGFTDNVPIGKARTDSITNNQALSLARAEYVRDILANTVKMDPNAIQVKGYGNRYPIVDNANATPVGRMKNRTVVVVIMANSKSPPEKETGDAFLQFEK
ncbi:OmpA family protein [Thermodesulfobacteriota bacterium]